MPIYDCIVIGAGPAGGSAAYFLARAGCSVLVLEKAKFPRYKCCGGGLPRKVADIFDFDLSPLFEREIKGTVFSWLSRDRRYERGEEILGWVVKREMFDDFLIRRAAQAGAEFKEEAEVIDLREEVAQYAIVTPGGNFSARTVIAADGADSLLGRRIYPRFLRSSGFALEARIPMREEFLRQRGDYISFDLGGVPGGYGWLFPRRDHISAGVATRRSGFRRLRGCLENYLEREGLIGEYRRDSVRGANIPFGIPPAGLVRGRCLLAGDAAGLVDRVAGEGIYYALKSGELAARAITHFLAGRSALAKYRGLVWQSFGKNLCWSHFFSRLFSLSPHLVFKGVISNERRLRKAMRVILGELSYRDLIFG